MCARWRAEPTTSASFAANPHPPVTSFLVGGPDSNAVARRLAAVVGVSADELAKLGPEGYRIKSGVAADRRVVLVAGGGRVGSTLTDYWASSGEALQRSVNRR